MIRRKSRANKGQFFVIAALLVSVVLVGGVVSTYTLVRYPPVSESPQVLGSIDEMNKDIESILDFTVGYYGSILQVTGNSTYAQGLTTNYLSSGLVNIARSHPDWNPSFKLESNTVSTCWFMPESYSKGNISVTYSLGALGIEGITYETSSALTVNVLESEVGKARINVTRDNSEPELGLTVDNFWFYNYSYADSTWELVNPTNVLIASNGVYTVTLPTGVDHDSYSVQIEDNRGLVVSAFYSQASLESDEKIPHYTYTFDWESTGVSDIYNSLSTDTFAIELLQNGTLKWLGSSLEVTPASKPIPPVSVKAFRVNATIGGNSQEVPFQVEDWASNYLVPLGLSGNDTLFNNGNMLVFLVDNEVSEITLWWDGNDTAIQTPYAWQNVYFSDNPSTGSLNNGFLELYVDSGAFYVQSSVIGEWQTYRTDFLRINNDMPDYGAGPAYVIYNGIVRDIVQQEPEYGGGVSGCPNFYAQVYITLPANTPYYTYAARTIFVDSGSSRTINDLSLIQLDVSFGTPLTEDGTSGGYPVTNSSAIVFYDGYPTGWDHHWSQINSGSDGAGFMFTDAGNQALYVFDDSNERGALDIHSNSIEVNPVESSLSSVSFTTSQDLVWYGAVVTFNTETIYRTSDDVGLWVMVENPPAVSMEEPILGLDFVDAFSNEDLSADKGSHSAFNAQKSGPNSVHDTLTEVMTGNENTEEYVDTTSDFYAPSDIGSHSSFSALQASPDSVMDTLQETNTGGGSDQWVSPTGHQDPGNDWDYEGDAHDESTSTSASTSVPGNGWSDYLVLTHSAIPCDSIRYNIGRQNSVIDRVEVDIYAGGGWINVYSGSGTWWSWRTITFTEASVTQVRFRFHNNFHNPRSAYVREVDFLEKASNNYELDLEVTWTGVDSSLPNEYLAIYGGTMGAEDIAVDVWSGSDWQNVFTDLSSGWNNVSVSSWLTDSTFTIRFRGGNDVGDSTLDTWEIDAALLHVWNSAGVNCEIDLEVQWTNADYDETNEELCIYVGEVASENLRLDVWTGSGWDNLFSSLNVGWNNATVSSYLTGSTFTIRFVGATETGDSTQDYWTIDATLLHTWS